MADVASVGRAASLPDMSAGRTKRRPDCHWQQGQPFGHSAESGGNARNTAGPLHMGPDFADALRAVVLVQEDVDRACVDDLAHVQPWLELAPRGPLAAVQFSAKMGSVHVETCMPWESLGVAWPC